MTSIPGACALITALTLSGLPTKRFVFEGFLPVPKKERRERLAALANEDRTFVLHEAPHKLRTTLDDLLETLGDTRRISLCRELTKTYEEVLRMTLCEAVDYYAEREPRGEYVLVIEGGTKKTGASEVSAVSPTARVAYHMENGMSKKEAIRMAAKECGISKNELYDLLLQKGEE